MPIAKRPSARERALMCLLRRAPRLAQSTEEIATAVGPIEPARRRSVSIVSVSCSGGSPQPWCNTRPGPSSVVVQKQALNAETSVYPTPRRSNCRELNAKCSKFDDLRNETRNESQATRRSYLHHGSHARLVIRGNIGQTNTGNNHMRDFISDLHPRC